jgi:hypothetical protein
MASAPAAAAATTPAAAHTSHFDQLKKFSRRGVSSMDGFGTVTGTVAELAQRGDVSAATAENESGTLGEIGAGNQRADERRDLRGVGAAVGVDHHDDVPGGRGEAASQGVAFT